MAKYELGSPEKREKISTKGVDKLRTIADNGEVDAYSIQYQHPRFKSRYSDPHFYVKFRQGGVVCTADGASREALDAEIEDLYFQ